MNRVKQEIPLEVRQQLLDRAFLRMIRQCEAEMAAEAAQREAEALLAEQPQEQTAGAK